MDELVGKIKNFLKKLKWTPFDSYILKNFLLSIAGSLVFLVVIYEVVQFFNELRYLPKNVDGWGLFLFHFYDGVFYLGIFQPFSFIFATVFVMSRIAQSRELVAVVSSGTSVYRIGFYTILFTFLYYLLLTFYLQNNFIFPTYQKRWIIWQKVFHNYKTDEAIERLKDNRNFSIFGNHNLLYIVDYYDSISKELNKVTVVKFQAAIPDTGKKIKEEIEIKNEDIGWLITNIDRILIEKGLTYSENIKIGFRIDAEKAIWDVKEKKWRFNYGTLRMVENNGESFKIQFFTNASFDFIDDPPYYFEKIWYPVDAMKYDEAKRYVEKLKKTRQEYKGEAAAYYSKFSYALGIIFVVLLGIGIIDMSKRKISFIINLMISMLIFVLYYLFYALGISFAAKGNISPFLGANLGTVFLAIFSSYLFLKVKT